MNRYPRTRASNQYSSGDTQSPRRRRPPPPPLLLLLLLPPLGEGRRHSGVDDVQLPNQLSLLPLGRSETPNVEQRVHLVRHRLLGRSPRRERLLRLLLLLEGAVQEEGQSCGVESFVDRELWCGQRRELTRRRWRPQPSERAVREALHLQHPGSRVPVRLRPAPSTPSPASEYDTRSGGAFLREPAAPLCARAAATHASGALCGAEPLQRVRHSFPCRPLGSWTRTSASVATVVQPSGPRRLVVVVVVRT